MTQYQPFGFDGHPVDPEYPSGPLTCGFARATATGVVDLRNCAIHANRPTARALRSSPGAVARARGSDRFALIAVLHSELFVDSSKIKAESDAAPDPITSYEMPVQQTRTGFRHPHGPDGGYPASVRTGLASRMM